MRVLSRIAALNHRHDDVLGRHERQFLLDAMFDDRLVDDHS